MTPAGSSGPQGPELRIGDAEREEAVHALGEHYAAGRLSKEEYDERSDRAYQARTRSALWPLFADLPRPEAERVARPGPQGPRRGWGLHPALLPVLMVALAVSLVLSLLVGHPVFLVVLLAFLVLRSGRRRRGWHRDWQRDWR